MSHHALGYFFTISQVDWVACLRRLYDADLVIIISGYCGADANFGTSKNYIYSFLRNCYIFFLLLLKFIFGVHQVYGRLAGSYEESVWSHQCCRRGGGRSWGRGLTVEQTQRLAAVAERDRESSLIFNCGTRLQSTLPSPLSSMWPSFSLHSTTTSSPCSRPIRLHAAL